jgi:hypothetical protein
LTIPIPLIAGDLGVEVLILPDWLRHVLKGVVSEKEERDLSKMFPS